ncbi:MAG: uroporphyrinogen-III synthase [Deltaproteobacteria bacterium]|nr:uroporphyrinogen-III synthase [Deltaproteobacteria bacterium]
MFFESRRGDEMGELIRAQGGVPLAAPAIEEQPLQPGPDVIEFVSRLRRDEVDLVLFLTRGGVEALPAATHTACSRAELIESLRGVPLGVRGPKTEAAVRGLIGEDDGELIVSDAPHSWNGLLDAVHRAHPVGGAAVAVIEHGSAHGRLRAALIDRGAIPLSVALYRWALPEDTGPLLAAIEALISGHARVALFTSTAQIDSLVDVAAEAGRGASLHDALARCFVGAVGAVTAERLRVVGIEPNFIPDDPRMADLVRGAGERLRDFDQPPRAEN